MLEELSIFSICFIYACFHRRQYFSHTLSHTAWWQHMEADRKKLHPQHRHSSSHVIAHLISPWLPELIFSLRSPLKLIVTLRRNHQSHHEHSALFSQTYKEQSHIADAPTSPCKVQARKSNCWPGRIFLFESFWESCYPEEPVSWLPGNHQDVVYTKCDEAQRESCVWFSTQSHVPSGFSSFSAWWKQEDSKPSHLPEDGQNSLEGSNCWHLQHRWSRSDNDGISLVFFVFKSFATWTQRQHQLIVITLCDVIMVCILIESLPVWFSSLSPPVS